MIAVCRHTLFLRPFLHYFQVSRFSSFLLNFLKRRPIPRSEYDPCRTDTDLISTRARPPSAMPTRATGTGTCRHRPGPHPQSGHRPLTKALKTRLEYPDRSLGLLTCGVPKHKCFAVLGVFWDSCGVPKHGLLVCSA